MIKAKSRKKKNAQYNDLFVEEYDEVPRLYLHEFRCGNYGFLVLLLCVITHSQCCLRIPS